MGGRPPPEARDGWRLDAEPEQGKQQDEAAAVAAPKKARPNAAATPNGATTRA